MKLYYSPGSCALACWIAMEWAGAEYEVVKVNPSSQEYKKINPLGVVPALDIGGKRLLGQTEAILNYIVDRFPEKDLGSNPGAENRFVYNETMCFLTGDFHPAFWPMFAPGRFTTSKSGEVIQSVREASYELIARVMSHLDGLIGDSGHVYQGKRTVADPYAYVMARWSERAEKSWQAYDNLAKFMERMERDPGVQRVQQLAK